MHEVETPDELAELVKSEPRVRVRGGGTKSASSTSANVSVAKLSGVLQYDPDEFTFTALSGTPITEVEELLAEKNQYLPFDPPLACAGATLGGTVATGLSGSDRFRYGGIRDFLIGARIVTGEGELVMTGGKVVKNAAGFDFPKLMVGSLGCFGLLTELTFKVFPRPKRFATIIFETDTIRRGMEIIRTLVVSKFDLACVDLDETNHVTVRLGGLSDSVAERSERLLREVSAPGKLLPADEEAQVWRNVREFSWRPASHDIVKIAITPDKVMELSERLGKSPMRVCVGGHLAWVAWPEGDEAEELDRVLRELDCAGMWVTGRRPTPYLGPRSENHFAERLLTVLDPHKKFSLA